MASATAFCVFALFQFVTSEGGLAPNWANLQQQERGEGVTELNLDQMLRREAGRIGTHNCNMDRDDSSWMVLFCKTGDANCAQLATFERLGQLMVGPSSDVRFGAFDCSLREANEALCMELGVKTYPTLVHYQKGQRIGNWTSESRVEMFSWLYDKLFNEVGETSAQEGASKQYVPSKSSDREHIKSADQTFEAGQSLVPPVAGVSHLKYVREFIVMEDCMLSRVLSGALMVMILAKCAWILVTGAESDVSTLY